MMPINSFHPPKPTKVYETYWQFAAERQEIFFRRLEGQDCPWTNDTILSVYKFTNAYRATDRVTQYLIREVIYRGDESPQEVFFRTIIFRIFNSINTWEHLVNTFGSVRYADFRMNRYEAALTSLAESSKTIYSPAYIMPSGKSSFGFPKKHQNHLCLVQSMMKDQLYARLSAAASMQSAFELLKAYPMVGNFLAYQHLVDINYSEITNFSENEFVMPGPGARDGIRKCFSDLGNLTESEVIRLVTERQEEEFSQRGIRFKSLFGRPLHLIDCQNLFCEVDKYSRIKHPDIPGRSGRTRIKQKFRPMRSLDGYWFPPKWRIWDGARPPDARV